MNSPNPYLATEVQTATPQRLRKMLLDAAVRFAGQANEHYQNDKEVEAHESLDRCSLIVEELLRNIQGEDEVLKRMKGIYAFLLTKISEIRGAWSVESMKDVIEVLEMERETWRQLCEIHPERVEAERDGTDMDPEQAQRLLDKSPPEVSPGHQSFELDA
ncbi:MAG: flagellar export chaperone FliS [Planctomycetota bacterium]|nr:flagellar export chaperone FliS [Planctomycetota bacterium]